MDDILEIYVGRPPGWLRAMRGTTFYGDLSKLEGAKSGEYAGLRLAIIRGCIWTAPLTPNESPLAQRGQLTLRRFTGGRSFSSVRRRLALIMGQIIYTVDRITGPRWHFEAQVAFTLRELSLHQYSDHDICTALHHLQRRYPYLDFPGIWRRRHISFLLAQQWRLFAFAQATGPFLREPLPQQ